MKCDKCGSDKEEVDKLMNSISYHVAAINHSLDIYFKFLRVEEDE
jgi:hypothetical protein